MVIDTPIYGKVVTLKTNAPGKVMVMNTPVHGKAVTLKTNAPWESYGDEYFYIWQGSNTEDKRPLGKLW